LVLCYEFLWSEESEAGQEYGQKKRPAVVVLATKIATGTGHDGPFEFTGCDRVQTRDGHVCENYVFCDDPFFVRVAAELGSSRR